MTTSAEIESLQQDVEAALTLVASFASTPQTTAIMAALATAQAAAAQLTPTPVVTPPTPPTPPSSTQMTIIYDTTGSYTWTAPPGVTSVTVNGSAKTVVPGTVYPLVIGTTCSFNGVTVLGTTVSLTYAYNAGVATGVSLGQYEVTMAAMSSGTLAATCANMKAIGCTYVRVGCIFTGGTTVPTTYDSVILAVKAAGMKPLIVFQDYSSSGAAVFATGAGSYAAWCPLAVEHFVSLIGTGATYELANEVNLGGNWASGSCSPTTYATCVNAAAPAMLAVDPTATVLFSSLAAGGTPTGATTGSSMNPVDFLAACYDEVSPLPVTAFGLHPYTWSALGDGQVNGGYPNEAETYNPFYTLSNMYASMTSHGDGAKKIWGTEFGYEIGTVNGTNGVTMTADQQATGLAIAYQVWASLAYTGPFLAFSYEDESDDGDWGLYTSSGVARPAVAIFEAGAAPYIAPSVPGAATGLSASVSGTTVTLNWTNGTGATGVHIYQDGTQITGPSGTPTTFAITGVTGGSHSYYVANYSAAGNGAKSATVNVAISVPTIGAIANQTFTQGTVITPIAPTVSGGTAPYAWSVTPTLPAGLAQNSAMGTIGGTPSASQTAASYTVKVTDHNGLSGTKAFTITVAAPVPPPTTALIGLWNPGSTVTAAQLDVTQSIYLDYAYSPEGTNTWTIYTLAAVQAAAPYRLNLKVGALTSGQATAIAELLVEGGQANAIVTPMWEYNQGTYYPLWNQATLTAAEYMSIFEGIVTAMDAVSGSNFTYTLNCNGGDANNLSGRTTFDVYMSGTRGNGQPIVGMIGVDQYDNAGSPAAAVANVQEAANFATTKGVDWCIQEWGLWTDTDDPAFIDAMATYIKGSTTCAFQTYFSLSGTSDLSVCPNSKAQYIGEFGTPESDVPGAPTLSAPSVSGTSVTLNWTAPEFAATYGVYRDGVLVGEGTPETSWVNTSVPVGTHAYQVFAINSGGTAGPNSNTEDATVSSGGGGGGGGSTVPVYAPPGGVGSLIFNSDFSTMGNASGSAGPYFGIVNGKANNSVTSTPSNINIVGGQLVLTLSSDSVGAEVTTCPASWGDWPTPPEGGFSFTGGYVEFSFVMPAGGWWAVWTSGQNWPTDGEYDIAENLGSGPSSNYHSAPGSVGGGSWSPTPAVGSTVIGGGLWTPGSSCVSYMNGTRQITLTQGESGIDIVSVPNMLLLNIGYGGSDSSPGDKLILNWIRAWNLP